MDSSFGHAVPNHTYSQTNIKKIQDVNEWMQNNVCSSLETRIIHKPLSSWERAKDTIYLTMCRRQQLLLWDLVNNHLVGRLKQRIKWILWYEASKLNLFTFTWWEIYFITFYTETKNNSVFKEVVSWEFCLVYYEIIIRKKYLILFQN